MIHDLKSYRAMKDSGVPWLGDVPEHWQVTRLSRCVTQSNAGEVIDKGWWGRAGEVLFTCARQPLSSDFPSFPAHKRTTGKDLLLTRNATPYVHRPPRGAIYSNVVQRINLLDGMNREFVALALEQSCRGFRGYGVSIESLNYEMWKVLSIVLPPLTEQDVIVLSIEYMDRRIRNCIRAKQKLIALLNEQKQAISHSAITCGLDPNVRLKHSGNPWIADIPEHWSIKKLKYVAHVQTGITLGKNYGTTSLVSRPYLRVANVQAGYLDLSRITTVNIPLAEATACKLQPGDVLMTEGGDIDKLGRGYIWQGEIPDCIHQNHIFAVRSKRDELLPKFLALLMSSNYGRRYFQLTAKQTTNLASTNSTTIKAFPLVLPNITEQGHILDHLKQTLTPFDTTITKFEKEIALLHEYRIRLIADVVTGKLDVRGVELLISDEAEALEGTDDAVDADIEEIIDTGEATDGDE